MFLGKTYIYIYIYIYIPLNIYALKSIEMSLQERQIMEIKLALCVAITSKMLTCSVVRLNQNRIRVNIHKEKIR
jgi:hypothetical protein